MQVLLWTDNGTLHLQKNNNITFEAGVQTRNITEVIPHMLNYDIIAKLKNIGAITDILKYEVMKHTRKYRITTNNFIARMLYKKVFLLNFWQK